MVEALTNEMTFYGIEKATKAIIEIRTEALDEESRAELRTDWKQLRKRFRAERERRNRFAHSSVTIEEDLGGAIHVASSEPETYSAEELRDVTEKIKGLTENVEELAVRILMLPFA